MYIVSELGVRFTKYCWPQNNYKSQPSEPRCHAVEVYVPPLWVNWSGDDLDLLPLTLKNFSAMPAHMIGKLRSGERGFV